MGYYNATPGKTDAYATDSGHEYFGLAARGAKTSTAAWQIFVMWKTGSNWVIMYPIDSTTGLASDQPKFVWDDVLTYTYGVLGT